MRRRLLALALLGAACSPTTVSIEAKLDELDLPAAGMVVVALLPEDPEQAPAVFKHRLPTPLQSVGTFRGIEGSPSLLVATYLEDDEKLSDGLLLPLPTQAVGIRLREPDRALGERVYRSVITDELAGPWTEESSLPAEVQTLQFEASACPCVQLEAKVYALGQPETLAAPGIAVALTDDRALVSTRAGEYYAVSADAIEPLELPRGLPNNTALRTQSGVVWLFGSGGRASRTSTATELSFVSAPPDPSRAEIRRAVATESAQGTIIYTYGSSRVSAFDGRRWVLVYDEAVPAHWQVDMEAVSATEVWITSANRPTLTRIHDISIDFDSGTVQREVETIRPSNEPSQAFSSLTWLPVLGVVAGSQSFGEIFAGDQSGFEQLPLADLDLRSLRNDPEAPTRLGTRSYALETLGQGFFGVGALGASIQYHPGLGFCNFDRFSGDAIVVLSKVGDDFVMLTEHEVRTASALYLRDSKARDTSSLCGTATD